MGQKTHPTGFRLGVILPWRARWFATHGNEYASLMAEDLKVRQLIKAEHKDSGISHIDIDRTSKEVRVTIQTSRPGVIIGRTGKRIEELVKALKDLTGKKVQIDTFEIRVPEMDATQTAQNIAYQLENRMAFRRVMRSATQRTMQAGALGIKVLLSGRLGGAEIARSEKLLQGSVPLHTLNAWIDFSIAEAFTTYGVIGVKVWIYRGNRTPKSLELDMQAEENMAAQRSGTTIPQRQGGKRSEQPRNQETQTPEASTQEISAPEAPAPEEKPTQEKQEK